jgi:predicted metal-dependent HD superfamily phosphohydrolase
MPYVSDDSGLNPAIRAAFNSCLPDAGAAAAMIIAVEAAYADPARHYHNLKHLDRLVSELETVRAEISDWELLMLAVAYHDVIYDTARPDNEEASAGRAADDLNVWLELARLQHLQHIILTTKHHEASSDSDTNLFCDADLAILGGHSADYDAYAAQIRQEYDRYDDASYNSGRAAVLRKLLEQPALFKTKLFQDRYELKARRNISYELQTLNR